MALSFDNLSKPSNKKFKLIADILLYTLPLYSVAIAAIIPDQAALIMNTIITCVVITIKGITKFTEEVPVVETVTEEGKEAIVNETTK
jgi:hypothetical protein